jgi:ureidoacrylate peracid hydrolase
VYYHCDRFLKHHAFENGTWGGEIRREFEPQPGEIVACSSGFANTDLDLLLKKQGMNHVRGGNCSLCR